METSVFKHREREADQREKERKEREKKERKERKEEREALAVLWGKGCGFGTSVKTSQLVV